MNSRRIIGNPEVGIFALCCNTPYKFIANHVPRQHIHTRRRNGLERDERAVAGTRWPALAITIRKKREFLFGSGSVLKQCKPAEHISTVSTYHAYEREQFRSYRAASTQSLYLFHR